MMVFEMFSGVGNEVIKDKRFGIASFGDTTYV